MDEDIDNKCHYPVLDEHLKITPHYRASDIPYHVREITPKAYRSEIHHDLHHLHYDSYAFIQEKLHSGGLIPQGGHGQSQYRRKDDERKEIGFGEKHSEIRHRESPYYDLPHRSVTHHGQLGRYAGGFDPFERIPQKEHHICQNAGNDTHDGKDSDGGAQHLPDEVALFQRAHALRNTEKHKGNDQNEYQVEEDVPHRFHD